MYPRVGLFLVIIFVYPEESIFRFRCRNIVCEIISPVTGKKCCIHKLQSVIIACTLRRNGNNYWPSSFVNIVCNNNESAVIYICVALDNGCRVVQHVRYIFYSIPAKLMEIQSFCPAALCLCLLLT